MSYFEVNPHTLRIAAVAFANAQADVQQTLAGFQDQAALAGAATGDSGAARAYDQLFDSHLTALRNLQQSLGEIADGLLAAALRYDSSDDDMILSGDERP